MFTDERKAEILREAKGIFFKAMLAGWVGEDLGSCKMEDENNGVAIEFIDGDYRVLDRYYTTPYSEASFGTTIIFYQGNPIWMMHYAGLYKGIEAVRFLREVLAKAYQAKEFFGGRGCSMFADYARALWYTNAIEKDRDDFQYFKGREEITGMDGLTKLGFHEYSGRSLF
ncbi:MAG: hypothetical protein UT41_C0001G0495 [Candidatus Wolfebacteria bacterium GW2011_GWC2_39_22]|uniref:DUF5680 domain-containing protein n=1 Tax=Candidatus Wolfebacteria bacterium GW2011_GWC2_39_22 TaxID=1619013 RepID=A0A0G0NJC9_9BACT|nr:MAG: hypothetical protein UT41_C0001G0495 [Candidatus Wolfebacteria bacterium GW2011_GWC2_39_22]HBI25394.1 hypothetical protein [Candidatus Wolfebacteria bacterium]